MSHRNQPDRSRSRSRDKGKNGKSGNSGNSGNSNTEDTRDFSKMNKQDRRDEMKKESSDKQVWGNIAREEDELYEKEKLKVPEAEKEKANFGLSGALAKDEVHGNTYNGVVLKWSEPLDSAKPSKQWRLYVFKNDEISETLHLHRQSAYLFGRDKRVADIELKHESCSKQHAVIQYRSVPSKDARDSSGNLRKVVKPYIMDLGSTHKTFINGKVIEDARYYELRERDSLTFGGSSREYLLLHDSSAGVGAIDNKSKPAAKS